VLLAIVVDRGLDRILGQDRTVDLDRRQCKLLGDLRVADRGGLVKGLALDPLGHQRRRRNCRAAAVGLEAGILDDALLVDLDLQFHHVAASRGADHAGADAAIALVERTDVARILVVINDLAAVCHVISLPLQSKNHLAPPVIFSIQPHKSRFALLCDLVNAPPTAPC
jgi:hypothetical protein